MKISDIMIEFLKILMFSRYDKLLVDLQIIVKNMLKKCEIDNKNKR